MGCIRLSPLRFFHRPEWGKMMISSAENLPGLLHLAVIRSRQIFAGRDHARFVMPEKPE